eukprot:TRINITY_DN15_c0_g1_i1.p1 TRINITY_DN15_c0_g1~~TRINITY_DN15_c0_g1_i1.p1  ORF type:complete len:604 (-),score=227.35 TRINITY_DN15_c0_g1_i1:38-1795(-)
MSSYASVLTSGVSKGNKGKRPSPIARPAPIAPPKKQVAAVVSAEEQIANSGLFGTLLPAHIIKIAVYAGPSGLCNLGCSSKYLQSQLLNTAVWNRVKDQLPTNPKLGIVLNFDLPAGEIEAEGAELKEGGVVSINAGQFSREANRSKLVAYWSEIVAEAQASRTGALEFTLGGGIAVDIVTENSQNVRLYTGENVADIPVWFDGVQAVLGGQTPYTLKLATGTATLTRVGRGGTSVVISANGEKETFNLSDLVIAFRAAGKQYLNVIGRINSALKASAKSDDETEAAAALERSNSLVALLQESRISRAIKGVSEIVESNKIPDEKFQAAFAKKRAEKARSQAQAFVEYENMLTFVMDNLPADYEETKAEAIRLQEQAVVDEENREARFQEKRAARIAERNAEKENQNGEAAAPKKAKKAKAVKVKETDKDGFVTETVQMVGGKKSKKKKSALPPSAAIPKKKKSVGTKLLAANPYNAVLAAQNYTTPTEAMVVKASKKGKSVLSQRGQGKSGTQSSNSPKEMPKNTSAQKKKQKKAQKKRFLEAQREAQVKSQEVATEGADTNLPVLGAATAVVVLGAIYYFGLL